MDCAVCLKLGARQGNWVVFCDIVKLITKNK